MWPVQRARRERQKSCNQEPSRERNGREQERPPLPDPRGQYIGRHLAHKEETTSREFEACG